MNGKTKPDTCYTVPRNELRLLLTDYQMKAVEILADVTGNSVHDVAVLLINAYIEHNLETRHLN